MTLLSQNSVLLQKATAQVSSTDERYSRNLRILFNSRSHFSYISPKAKEVLKLRATSKQKTNVKTFSNASNSKELHLVEVTVKSKGSLLNIYENVFVNEKQNIEFAKHKHLNLQHLELADNNKGSLLFDFKILIGTLHYWSIKLGDLVGQLLILLN